MQINIMKKCSSVESRFYNVELQFEYKIFRYLYIVLLNKNLPIFNFYK